MSARNADGPPPAALDDSTEGSFGRQPRGVAARAADGLIRLYQHVTAGRPSPCRYWPTCSNYAREAIELHGLGRGVVLTTRRLARCRPLAPSGFDPVPPPRIPKTTSDGLVRP